MQKINCLLLFTIPAMIVFHVCQARQKISSSDINKNEISNDTIVKEYSDSICYIFSVKDITQINSQTAGKIDLVPGKAYSETELYYSIQPGYGENIADEFISIARNYGKKTTKQKVIEENTKYYLDALEGGYSVFPSLDFITMSTVKLERPKNLPSNILELFSDYEVFNEVFENDNKKRLSTVYKGKLTPLLNLINIALSKKEISSHLTMEDKIEILLFLIKGEDIHFSIQQIADVTMKDPRQNTTWNIEVTIITQNKEEKFGIVFLAEKFSAVYLILNNRIYHISSPFIVY